MRVFQDPATGTYIREDGQPGYGCARCGNGYATAAARDDINAHGCEGLSRDLATFADAKGTLENGYDEDVIDSLASDLSAVEFVCLWDYYDSFGFGGDSEIIGREIRPDGTHGAWKPMHPDFWKFLFEPAEPLVLDDVTAFLAEEDHEIQNLDAMAYVSGANVAHGHGTD